MSLKGESFLRTGPINVKVGSPKGSDRYNQRFREAEEEYFAKRAEEKANEEKPLTNSADPEYMHVGVRTEEDTEVLIQHDRKNTTPYYHNKKIERDFVTDRSQRFFNKKQRDKLNLSFLRCVCGTAAYILQGPGVRSRLRNNEHQAGSTWAVCCPRCEISTPYYDFLEEARQTWNRHCVFGIFNQEINVDDWIGDPQIRKNDMPLNNLEKLDPKLKNYHEYFYSLDYKYMTKIQRMLSPGMIFDDYSDLCAYLNEAVHTPVSLPMIIREEDMENVGATRTTPAYDSDKKHSKWWKRFFEFEKWGQRFVITKIYDEPKPYSKNKMNPNKGRTVDSFRPKLATDTLMDEEIIGLVETNAIRYDFKKAMNAKEGKSIKNKAKKERKEKREYTRRLAEENYSEEEIEALVNEEYEIYEEDDLEGVDEEELRRLYGLEEDDDWNEEENEETNEKGEKGESDNGDNNETL